MIPLIFFTGENQQLSFLAKSIGQFYIPDLTFPTGNVVTLKYKLLPGSYAGIFNIPAWLIGNVGQHSKVSNYEKARYTP